MSSGSESSSASTPSSERRRRKVQKKLKNKIEKKSKKHKKDKKKKAHKEKKRSRKESTISPSEEEAKPIAPPRTQYEDNLEEPQENRDNHFGPALPPHLLKRENFTGEETKSKLVIGPIMPANIDKFDQEKGMENNFSSETEESNISPEKEDDPKCYYGPLPISNESEMSSAQIELEKRALELKMAAIDGTVSDKVDQKVREEWMLELPEVGLKGGLAALNNIKRGFYQGKERPDFSDRSSWTKTPQTGEASKIQSGPSNRNKEELRAHAQTLYEKQRDAEQEALAKKHKKKHKRDESLVDIHQKKLRKEEKRKAKELKDRGEKPERRPFSRDIDLKLNKIDSNQTKQIVDKAKILNTKFSSGRSKYL